MSNPREEVNGSPPVLLQVSVVMDGVVHAAFFAFKRGEHSTAEALSAVLAAMRSLAVIPVATCVLRTELLQLQQERDETFRAFAARVRGKAETCAFDTRCECGRTVDVMLGFVLSIRSPESAPAH